MLLREDDFNSIDDLCIKCEDKVSFAREFFNNRIYKVGVCKCGYENHFLIAN